MNGRILVQEPHMQGIMGQLNYLPQFEQSLYCLHLGQSMMLLLVYSGAVIKGKNTLKSYRRVGISSNAPENFFGHGKAKIERLVLL